MKIVFFLDQSCKMAAVKAGRKWIMTGNYWDFHPGCHGIDEYGNFHGPMSLAFAVQRSLLKQGKKNVSVWRQFAKYNDDGSWSKASEPEEVK